MSDQRPGVSGKDSKGNWTNKKELKEQREFRDELEESVKGYSVQGRGADLYGRSDLDNQNIFEDHQNITQEQIAEALRRTPGADISNIQVFVENEIVRLEGRVSDVHEKRLIENIVSNISGVKGIINHLIIIN